MKTEKAGDLAEAAMRYLSNSEFPPGVQLYPVADFSFKA